MTSNSIVWPSVFPESQVSLSAVSWRGLRPANTETSVGRVALPDVKASVPLLDTLHSLMVATIDADVANIPENEFRSVFMGGIVVMLGGLISSVLVGTIVNSRNLYANIVADSYLQKDGNNQVFWSSMSDEEKKRAQDLVVRLRSSGNEADASELEQMIGGSGVDDASSSSTAVEKPTSDTEVETSKKPVDMFSDYD